ncbi:MAG: (p)ppGpp synthetase [Desulfobulbaceae bacterium]|jgi:putative GTP pyrophosphokinase|nr:(p)ppGpp synthetase [Desulfobulbaceae bacterium]
MGEFMPSLDFETERQRFLNYVNDNIELLRNAESSFSTLIKSLLATSAELSAATVTSRVKGREECINKFSRKYQSKLEEEKKEYEIRDYVTDLIGIRIVCLYEKNIQEIGKILVDNLCLIDSTDKSKLIEQTENTFGYKGLHLDLKLDATRDTMPEYFIYKDIYFEVQIRTIIQDAWSVLDHKIKYKKSIPLGLKRRINSLAALFETADREFYSIREETEKLEKITKEKINTNKDEEGAEILNVFHFEKIAEQYFPEFHFSSRKIDALVEEILKQKEITEADFEKLIKENITTVNQYKEFLKGEHVLTPYTIIRHSLYYGGKESFFRILYEYQRKTFDKWLEQQ